MNLRTSTERSSPWADWTAFSTTPRTVAPAGTANWPSTITGTITTASTGSWGFELEANLDFRARGHLQPERRPVWAIAATHDVGIDFSEPNCTFIHRVDAQIDSERAKVVDDLLFSGHVESLALVDRPGVPRRSQNATGDNLETDGKIAVAVLK